MPISPASTAPVIGFRLSSAAAPSTSTAIDRTFVADDLPDQPPELFGERHVGLQPRRFLGGQARHVDRVGDPAEQQEIAHLLGDLDRDIDLRFAGRGAEMRGRDEVGRAEQGRGGGRLGLEHVERGAGDLAAVERLLQRRLVDQPAARAIDDPHAGLGLRQRLARQDAARLVGQRRVQGDEVGAAQQFVELDLLDPQLERPLGRQEGIVGDDLHLEPERARWRRSSRYCRRRSVPASCRSPRPP